MDIWQAHRRIVLVAASLCALCVPACIRPAPPPCPPFAVPSAVAPNVVMPGEPSPYYPYPTPTPAPNPGLQPTPDPGLQPAPYEPPPAAAAPAVIVLRAAAPAQAAVGSTITMRIEASNSGGAANEVVVSYTPVAGAEVVDSTPPAETTADGIEWNLGQLPGGAARAIDLNLRVTRSGMITNCATVTSGDGESSRACAQTRVSIPAVEARMTAPDRPRVGEDVTFEITLINRSALAATGLVVLDSFDDGLTHAASNSPSPIERPIEDLPPGGSKTIHVTFRVDRPGRLCNRVEVTGEGGLQTTAEACVTALPASVAPAPAQPPKPVPPRATPRPAPATPPIDARPAVSATLTGPETQTSGEVARFLIDVKNTGSVALTDIVIVAAFDPALPPQSATEGHTADESRRLTWTYNSLAPGKRVRLDVECLCGASSTPACGQLTVSTKEGAREESAACVRIGSAQTQLELSIVDLADPVKVGKELTYEVRVTNTGDVPDSGVVLTAEIPQGMTLVAKSTIDPTRTHRFEQRGRTLTFAPIAEVSPGQVLVYRLRLRANQTGESLVRVTVDSQGLPQPVSAEETTKAFAEQ